MYIDINKQIYIYIYLYLYTNIGFPKSLPSLRSSHLCQKRLRVGQCACPILARLVAGVNQQGTSDPENVVTLPKDLQLWQWFLVIKNVFSMG